MALKCMETFDTDDSLMHNNNNDVSFVTEINTSIISDANASFLNEVQTLTYDKKSDYDGGGVPALAPDKLRMQNNNNDSIISTLSDSLYTPEKTRPVAVSAKKRGHRRNNNFHNARHGKKLSSKISSHQKLDRVSSHDNSSRPSSRQSHFSHSTDGRDYNPLLTHDETREYEHALQRYGDELRSLRKAGYTVDHPEVVAALRRVHALESIADAVRQSEELHAAAHVYELKGSHDLALKKYKKALDLKMGIFGEGRSHPSVALTLHKIGVVLWKSGAYDDAFQYLSNSLEMYKASQGKDLETAETVHSIGLVYLSMGQFNSAMGYFKEALKLRTGVRGNDHPDVARSLISIGMVLDEKGKHTKAMRHYRDGLLMQKASLGGDHVDVAATLNVIGVAHEKWGEYDAAMESYSEALWIYRSCLGNNHVDVAVTLNNVGQIHRYWGEFTEAMKAYQEALRIMRTVLGENHRNVATAVHNIALVYTYTKDYDKAIKLFREVLRAQRDALGDEHVDIAVTLESFGEVYEKKQKYDRAVRLYTKALRVRRLALGKHHIYVAITLDRLGRFYNDKLHDKEEALRRFTEALEVYQFNNVRQDHPYVVAVLQRIAAVEKSMHEYDADVAAGC
eukprot:CAMPEP_0172511908 /NCGR_PEP_ID=MMETSP1066-20121228/240231_1 /TAXON_ID=671091 /ORGANISM="Coscinodiscus wailesii, Strain CCMP2513" /LENGTH=621 /DNA_ID=CAMNT_0013291483 /DNA_START=134 /DNA_END=1999 /DNA_ORIENTATION=+